MINILEVGNDDNKENKNTDSTNNVKAVCMKVKKTRKAFLLCCSAW